MQSRKIRMRGKFFKGLISPDFNRIIHVYTFIYAILREYDAKRMMNISVFCSIIFALSRRECEILRKKIV